MEVPTITVVQLKNLYCVSVGEIQLAAIQDVTRSFPVAKQQGHLAKLLGDAVDTMFKIYTQQGETAQASVIRGYKAEIIAALEAAI